jgi:poly(A) polymerase
MATEIKRVSAERIREELSRILTEGHAAHGVRLLHESGMLPEILPAVEWNKHLERCLDEIPLGAPFDFAFGVLLHEVPSTSARRTVEELRLSVAEMKHVGSLVQNLPNISRLRSWHVHAVKRFLRMARIEDHLELARICAVAGSGDLKAYNDAVELSRKWTPQEISPTLLVTGDDLIRLGFAPGPAFKKILTAVEDEQLEGRLTTSEQAINFVKENYAP